jgi:Mce-associated membrane protein
MADERRDDAVSDIEEPEGSAEGTLASESVVAAPAEADATDGAVEAGEALPSEGEESAPTQTDDAAEPLTLPDERHSRTTELAARLRQSALAQVEAARAAQAAGGAISVPTAPAGPKIPALDEPSRRFAQTPMPPATPIVADKADKPDVAEEPEAPAAEPAAVVPVESGAIGEAAPPEPVTIAEEPANAIAESELTTIREVAPGDDASDRVIRVAAAGLPVEALDEAPAYLDGPVGKGTGGQWLILATLAVAALVVLGVVLLVIYAGKDSHDAAVAKTRGAALAAAKTETALALTYNYRTLDSDFAKAEAGMSKSFRADFAGIAAKSVTPLATKTHAVTTATIVSAGVISATSNSAQILVFADQTVENKLLNATSRLDKSVIDVSMVKQDGHWLINNLNPL